MDNDQMILISIQDVKVLEGNYETAVIMWWLDTKYPFTPLDFYGKEIDLGITLPTSSDTDGHSVTAIDIYGFETGPIAFGDISASTNSLIKLNELCQVIDYVKISINLPAGWSLISLPVEPLDATLSSLFPEAEVMYRFEREFGYVRVQENEDLQVGSGYWIHVYEDQNYVLTGQSIQFYSKTIYSDRWEMIGGCTSDAKASVDNCDIGVIYRFVQGTGYQRILDSEKLKACEGFWIKIKDVTDECELTVTGDSIEISLRNDGFYFNGKKWFVVGGNWRMIEYGQNFGVTAWFPAGNGVSIHRECIGTRLEVFRQAGITLIRVGLLDDGRTIFDINGNVVGFNDRFREDVSAILDLAKEKDIMVEFAIADFLIAGKEEEDNVVWLRGRREIIEDPQIRAQFFTDFFEPFLCEFGSHPVLFGFDLMNEPEWIISSSEGGGWEDVTDDSKDTSPINLVDLYTFFNEIINKIHLLAPKKFITVGVSIKFMDLAKNLDLDYLALHYYRWMGEIDELLSEIPDSEIWLLEEFPGNGNITDYLNAIYDVGGNGALLWNLSPEIDDQSYLSEEEESKLQEVRTFVDKTDCTDITIKLCL